jgi:hypothetical protein
VTARPAIVEIPTSVPDVVTGLRKLADEIESGKELQARFSVTVIVDEKDNTRLLTYGRCSPYERLGAMIWSAMHSGED